MHANTMRSFGCKSGGIDRGAWRDVSMSTLAATALEASKENHPRGDVTNHVNARGFVTSFLYNQRRQLTNTMAPTNLTA